MSWYDNGIMGDHPYATSGSINQPASQYGNSTYNCDTPTIVETFALNTAKGNGDTYTYLLNTFSLGTQIYMDFSVTRTEYDHFGILPYVTVVMTHSYNLRLKQGDTSINIGGGSESYISDYYKSGDVPGNLDFSIYGFNYASTNGNLYPGQAYPFNGSGAGVNSSIICVKDSEGLAFWVAGFPSVSVPYTSEQIRVNFKCNVKRIGRIPASILDNPSWFDPTADAVSSGQEGGSGFGVGGNVPDLPVSPTYPGTDMTFPSLPTGGSAFGFSRLTLYKPSASQLGDALDILYQDTTESTLETIIESCKKWWYKPDQYCISLMLSPVDASTNLSKNIKFGKYDSQVAAPFVSSQWQITDCGTINIPLKYGSFLDFEPHAKIKIYLPFIGLRSLNANEVIGGQIAIKYYTDMLTGASVCMLLVTRPGSNNTILYTFDCNLCLQIPLTAMSYSTVVQNLLSAGVAAVSLGAGVATGGVAGAAAIYGGVSGVANSGINAMSSAGSPDLTQSGSLSANTGVLSYPKPYVCIQMPIPTTPSNYNTEKGRPANIYMNIGSCKGYTVINNLHVDIPGITDQEIDMIRQAFRRGVYC